MKQIIIIVIALLLVLSGCKKAGPSSPLTSGSVIVVNEGNFGHTNASVSVYDPVKKAVTNNVFFTENGFDMGNVAQSLYLLNDTAYIVMNASQKILVTDAGNNFKYLYSINMPAASPRFFMPVSRTKAYVTELYANKIWVVDYRAGTILKTIAVTGWTEQMISWGGKVYVCEMSNPTSGPPSHNILAIDTVTDQVTASVSLISDPGSMVLTAQNKLLVLAPQQTSPALPASLYRIDIGTLSIEKKIDFSPTRTPRYIRYSPYSNQILYSDSGGIYTMSPTDTVIPASTFIKSNNWNVYGLNSDPATGDIYISDAIDYQQASRVMRYSSIGTSLDAFTAGIITNGFIFH